MLKKGDQFCPWTLLDIIISVLVFELILDQRKLLRQQLILQFQSQLNGLKQKAQS